MRYLIDGYNLMHAVVLLPGGRLTAQGLRTMRQRFLNELAARLGPEQAGQTTVVFDSSAAPAGLPRELRHKGITVQFAAPDEEADGRIEDLIACHTAPKQLTVVSTDHRIRLAAKRRRAKVQTSDTFWSTLQDRPHWLRPGKAEASRSAVEPERPEAPTDEDRAFWLQEFGELDHSPELRSAFRGPDFIPGDEDLARIAREVDEEFRDGL